MVRDIVPQENNTTSLGHLMFLDPSDINWDRKGKDKMIILMSSHKISFNWDLRVWTIWIKLDTKWTWLCPIACEREHYFNCATLINLPSLQEPKWLYLSSKANFIYCKSGSAAQFHFHLMCCSWDTDCRGLMPRLRQNEVCSWTTDTKQKDNTFTRVGGLRLLVDQDQSPDRGRKVKVWL